MQEAPSVHQIRPGWRREFLPVLALLLIGLGVKLWLLMHTTVLTRDGVGHILLAAKLEREPWADALNSSRQHPLYSIHILGVAKLLAWWRGDELDCLDWQLAAQWANILAGVLLAIPMYFLGKELFDRRVGFWAALAFQLLTVPARVLADVLIEGVYLLWATTAILFAVWGLRSQRAGWFALCGLAGGLSYLARPEGAVVVLSAGLVLLAGQCLKSWRIGRTGRAGWVRTIVCAGCLGVAALGTIAPYCWTIGGLTVKISPQQMLNPGATISEVPPEESGARRAESGAASTSGASLSTLCASPLGASLLLGVRFSPGAGNDVWDDAGPGPALCAVAAELCKTFGYVLWLPALAGVVFYWRRILADPRLAVVLVAAGVQLLLITRLAMTARYVSERHTVLVVLCGLPLAVAALFEIFRRIPRSLSTRWGDRGSWSGRGGVFDAPVSAEVAGASKTQPRPPVYAPVGRILALSCLLASIGVGLPKTLKPLHEHRKGHREAGVWLAQHWRPGDNLADPYGWVRFYSGEILTTLNRRNAAPSTHRHYVVIEPGDPDEERNRIMKTVSDRFGLGERVYCWPSEARPRVVIHRVEEPKPSGLVAVPVEQPHQR